MPNFETIKNFLDEHWITISLVNLALFVGFILIVMFAFSALPKDYWNKKDNGNFSSPIYKVIRNILALPVFIIGILMLFLPGQGLLTILLALLISDFNYKRELIKKIISKKKVRESLDALRTKMGKESFCWPASTNSDN